MGEAIAVRVRVLRADGLGGQPEVWQEYAIEVPEGQSVTGVLRQINEELDGSLAYRVSCHRGICASCIMRINGKQRLGCVTEVTGATGVTEVITCSS